MMVNVMWLLNIAEKLCAWDGCPLLRRAGELKIQRDVGGDIRS
jgi:hypothetical protein